MEEKKIRSVAVSQTWWWRILWPTPYNLPTHTHTHTIHFIHHHQDGFRNHHFTFPTHSEHVMSETFPEIKKMANRRCLKLVPVLLPCCTRVVCRRSRISMSEESLEGTLSRPSTKLPLTWTCLYGAKVNKKVRNMNSVALTLQPLMTYWLPEGSET